MNLSSRLDFIRNGMMVKRYHTVRTVASDTVAQHSHGVAMLCWLLTEGKASAELLMAALTHDLSETNTGDIPSPTKRALGMSELDDENTLRRHGLYTSLTESEARTLSLADKMEGLLFCLEEIHMGNRHVEPVADKYQEYIEEMRPLHSTEQTVYNGILADRD